MANDLQDRDVEATPARRPRFWPLTIATTITFVFLVSLGVWQLQRLAWKEGLIAEIETRQAAAPVAFAEALKMRRAETGVRYLRVRAKGTFVHDSERYYYAPDSKLGPGFEIYTPFQLAGGQGLIVVNRGFVPEPLKASDTRASGQVTGEQDIIGLVRLPGRGGAFTPDNSAPENLWFWRDFEAMTASLSVADYGPKQNLFVDAEQAAPGGWPRGVVRKMELSNRHFGYAVTWFGLALTLLGVYAALMWSRHQDGG